MTFLKKLPFVFVIVGMWACAPVHKANEHEAYNKAGVENAGLFQPSGDFAQVVSRIEPVAEAFCRDSGRPLNCDFEVIVDARDPENVNAFQTLRKNGRPLIVFTQALIDTTQNDDELAFVLGHEMAHHLEGHLHRQYQSARTGAILLGGITAITGASANTVESAQRIGAGIGARTYSKEFELEADRLGALVAIRAGYNAVRGAAFFARLPDPGDQFLGSHPPNEARIEMVRRVSLGY